MEPSLSLKRRSTRCAVKKTSKATPDANSTMPGAFSQKTGAPRIKSRIVPPPNAVTQAIRMNPTGSSCLRDALSAPEAATTATAIQADKATPSSKALIFCHSAATARAFVALLLALAPPAQSSESPSSAATTGSTRIG